MGQSHPGGHELGPVPLVDLRLDQQGHLPPFLIIIAHQMCIRDRSDSQKNATVKATAAGVVTKLYVDQGDMVSAGAPIADIPVSYTHLAVLLF